jgi:hypothetical protein
MKQQMFAAGMAKIFNKCMGLPTSKCNVGHIGIGVTYTKSIDKLLSTLPKKGCIDNFFL